MTPASLVARRPGGGAAGGGYAGLGGQRGLQLGLEALLGQGALDALGLGAVAEQDHRGYGEDPVVGSGLLVVVRVELDDPDVVALVGDLLEDRGHDPARAAPRRPEIDQDGGLGLDDLGLEVGVGDFADVRHQGSSSGAYFRKYSGRRR